MKVSHVSAFGRAARILALAAVTLGTGAVPLLAQTAGKIEGRVRDQAGGPIANAQVLIVGTAFNAETNPQGYYFINNVPAGTYSVRAAFIGYKSTQVDGVRVLSGQTHTVDVQLEQTPVEIQEITVVTQTQPLVPRDEVTSKQRIDGVFTDNLPVDRLNNVLALQPGVVASPTTNTLSIRGGRTDEAVTYIDGVPVSPGFRGFGFVTSAGTEIALAPNSLEEASVTTGSSSAEFGNAQSGIIAIQTRAGGSEYAGSFGYETDEPFGTTGGYGFNRFQGSFGGPIWQNLGFFVSAGLEGQRAIAVGFDAEDSPMFVQAGIDTIVAVPTDDTPTADVTMVPVYNYAAYRGDCDDFAGSTNPEIANNYGLDCQGVRTPYSARTTYNVQGKLNYTYGTGSRVSLTTLASQFQGRTFVQNRALVGQNLTYSNLYNPAALLAFRNWSRNATLNWTQNLSKSAERALALETYLSYQQDNTLQGPMTRESEQSTRDPFGGFMIGPIDHLWDFDNFPVNEELIQNFRLNAAGSRRAPLDIDNRAQYGAVDAYRNNAYALYNRGSDGGDLQFFESGIGGGEINLRQTMYKEDRYIGKANLDWQVDRYNRVKVGGEFTRYTIKAYGSLLDDQIFSEAYIEKPIRWNAFVEDRLDLGDVVLVGGLRYDYYDSRASRPAGFPAISTHPVFVNFGADSFFNDPNLWVRDQSHDYISPHVQVSFPVTDRTNFRLSYAHQVQVPDFALVFNSINTDVNLSNTNGVYGTDLDFGKTITFEFGIRHAFNDDMVLDLAAYNKDNLSNAAGRLVSVEDPTAGAGASNNIRFITNADFGNTRGIDVRLDRRFGNLFNGTLAYTFQDAKNTGSDPETYIDFGSRVLNALSGGNQPPPQAILPTDFSRPHTLAAAASLSFPDEWNEGSTIGSILENVGLFATFRYASGTPYTRCNPGVTDEDVLSGDNCDREFPEGLNGSRLPAFRQLNLRLTKGFAVGGVDLTAYLDARNVLNFRNIVQVFTQTDDIVNSAERENEFLANQQDNLAEAERSGVPVAGDGDIDLTFGGIPDPTAGCGSWVTQDGLPGAPNCIYMIRAEERWGDGDHIYTVAEQRRASDALYNTIRGTHNFTGEPRRMRVGVELNF